MRDFDKEATLYVWHMQGGAISLKVVGTGKGGSGRFYIGDGRDYKNERERRARGALMEYQRGKKGNSKFDVDGFEEQWENKPSGLNFSQDLGWGFSASEKIKIPGQGAQDCTWGLFLEYIAEWWGDRQCRGFDPMSREELIATALQVGGAAIYVDAPFHFFTISMQQIITWARNIRTRIVQLNEAGHRITQAVEREGLRLPLDPVKCSHPSNGLS